MPCRCNQQELELLPELEALIDSDGEFEDDPSDLFSEVEAGAASFDSLSESELEEEVDRRSRKYVRWAQHALNDLIGAGLTVDGISGRKTRSAIRRFQRQARITADGVVGSQTEAALIRAGADPPPGSRVITFEPEKIAGAIVLERFVFNSAAVQSFHRPIIQRIAAAVVSSQRSARPIRTVRLIGHTDSVGSDEFNRGLGLQRAKSVRRALQSEIDRQQSGLSSRIRITTDTRGESQPRTSNATRAGRVRNRRVEVGLVRSTKPPLRGPPTPRKRTSVLNVVAKSFIQPISRLGLIVCSSAPFTAQGKLAALGVATRAAFRENPRTDAKDGKYRLFSNVAFTVTCRGDKVLSVGSSFTDTDVGLECLPRTSACLQPPPLQMTSVRIRRINPQTIEFAWRGRGRPHNAAEVSFQLVCLRTSRFIWHEVRGRIECRNGLARVTNVPLRGSRFPSHRLFVDGVRRARRIQGPFSNLWVPSPRNPNEVR